MLNKSVATASQKENFKTSFAEIIKNNSKLKDMYTIQFFETAQAYSRCSIADFHSVLILTYGAINP